MEVPVTHEELQSKEGNLPEIKLILTKNQLTQEKILKWIEKDKRGSGSLKNAICKRGSSGKEKTRNRNQRSDRRSYV